MEKYIIDYFKNLFDASVVYQKVLPCKYAQQLKLQYSKNKEMWYKSIIPREKADELIDSTGNDYSKIWETYCECCFANINASTQSICYASDDFVSWLCEKCYNKLKLLSG